MGLAAKNAKSAKKTWPMVRLGDVCEKKIKRLRQINDEEFEYIDISSIDRKTKSIISTKEYQRGDAPGRAQQVVDEGDVLVSTVRPNLNAVAVVGKKQKLQRIASTGFCVLRPSANILSEYIFYCVQHDEFIAALVGVAEKAAYPSVTDDEVKSVSIPLPPLSVQREIVARLEKELGEADALAAKFKEIAENADAEFKAELDETFKNVEGEKVRLGEICEAINVGIVVKPTRYYVDDGEGIPAFRNLNVKPSYVDESEWVYVSESAGEENPRSVVKIGDVLIARSGVPGAAVAIDSLKLNGRIAIDILVVVPKQSMVNSKYLAWEINTSKCQAEIRNMNNGVALAHIGVKSISKLEIVIPSLPAQRAIVAKLDAAKERCEKLKAAAERGLRAAEDLRKAILAEAFEQ